MGEPVPGGHGGGSSLLGFVCLSVWFGKVQGGSLAGKGHVICAGRVSGQGPSSPAWGSSICPHKTSLPGLMFLLEAQTTNGGITTAPQTPAGPSFLPRRSCEALLRVGVGFQSPGSFIAFLRERSLPVLGSCVPDSSQNTL